MRLLLRGGMVLLAAFVVAAVGGLSTGATASGTLVEVAAADTDGDGIPNSVENKAAYKAKGGSPNHKDLWVEFDYMTGEALNWSKVFGYLVKAFGAGPIANPDGKKGITFHGVVGNSFPRQEVWAALLDPDVLARTVPGSQGLERTGDNEFIGQLTMKIGPVSGVFQGKVSLENLDPAAAAHVDVVGWEPGDDREDPVLEQVAREQDALLRQEHDLIAARVSQSEVEQLDVESTEIESQAIVVELDPARLEALLGREMVASTRTLIPQIVVRDPYIAMLLRAMASEVAQGCPAGTLYGQALSLALVAYLQRRFSVKAGREKRSHLRLVGAG